jgi:hypothetical protein
MRHDLKARFERNGCSRENSTTIPWNDFAGTTWNDFEKVPATQPHPHRSGWNAEPLEAVSKTASSGAFRSASFTKGSGWNGQA